MPVWSFGVRGSTVRVTRVAIPQVAIESEDESRSAAAPGVNGVSMQPDGTVLALFSGRHGNADQRCGADYTAHAIESADAVVMVLHEHLNREPGDCPHGALERAVQVELAAPLDGRAVISLGFGLPVPLR